MDTPILFYKIYQSDVKPIDYIRWALEMLKNDCTSFSLNILSSLSEPLNIFEVEDYFRRALREINLQEPSFEECAEYYIQYLSKKLLEDKNNAIDLAYKIYEVVGNLDYPEDLDGWYNISDMIDDFRYGDNISKVSKVALIITIKREAKKQLSRKKK
ncbi:hypothetical protein ACIQ4Z_15010 [Peribacillus asahii]|uniref:hypothetical protein n=1 Tax=Peribacillus asahii TaxID=228899 RepID=UPI00381E8E29